MLTLVLLLVLLALVLVILAAIGRAPVWIAVLLLTIAELVGLLPVR